MTTESLSLAPAAGSGVGRQLAELLLADPTFLPDLKQAFTDALKATVVIYDKGAKNWRPATDFRTRLNAAALILSHMEGEPIRRVVHQHIGDSATSPVEDLDRALEESPALLVAIERTLAKAKRRAAAKQANPVVQLAP